MCAIVATEGATDDDHEEAKVEEETDAHQGIREAFDEEFSVLCAAEVPLQIMEWRTEVGVHVPAQLLLVRVEEERTANGLPNSSTIIGGSPLHPVTTC